MIGRLILHGLSTDLFSECKITVTCTSVDTKRSLSFTHNMITIHLAVIYINNHMTHNGVC